MISTGQPRILIGFDGFIDTLSECVDVRRNNESYKQIASLKRFAEKVAKASGKSTNIECVVKECALGGNAPLCARALVNLSHDVHLIGCCGFPDVHPHFLPISEEGGTIITIGDPGLTEALEFADGKLLLGKMGELSKLSFAEAAARLPAGLLLKEVQEADFIVTVNWTMMPLVEDFWQWLLLYPNLIENKQLFVDLADPAKRTLKDLMGAIHLLEHLSDSCTVMLGVNLSEAEQLCSLYKLRRHKNLRTTSEELVKKLKISTLFIHSRKEVAVANLSTKDSASLQVPLCQQPVRSTGAGDVCNAGFIAAAAHKAPLEELLKSAVAASGVWVRTGQPPTQKSMADFLLSFAP